ncbi:MAG: hypothetical protein ACKO9Z_15050, partial [Planctomycetota bacterium]
MSKPCWIIALGLSLAWALPLRAEETAGDCYLIGNSLTWDTVPSRLAGPPRGHVECGVSMQQIGKHTEKPCVKDST